MDLAQLSDAELERAFLMALGELKDDEVAALQVVLTAVSEGEAISDVPLIAESG